MRTQDLIKGLQVLASYYSSPGGYNVGAEHDVLYGFPTETALSDEDLEKMIELGWHQEYDGRDYNKDYAKEDYRQDESWVAYV